MATHFSVLAWRIPGTGEPGGLPSMGSHRVGHDWSNLAAAAAVHFSLLIPKMLMFTLAISCLHYQFALIHGPNIPGSYAILLFIVLDFTSITSQIHSWVLFLLWLCLFILSDVISPLISHSILGTYRPGEFIFQCPIFLPFFFSFLLFMGFSSKNPEVVCHSLLQWTTFCQNSPPWPIHLGWPYMAWLIVSLS